MKRVGNYRGGSVTPDRYEEVERRALPNWETFFSTILEFIPGGSVKILELGCGTAFLTGFIREAIPDASITCIDRDPGMLAVARAKPGLEGVTFLEGDLRVVWPEGTFDVVVSSCCLDAIPPEERLTLLQKIARSLTREGRLIIGDVFLPEQEWEIGMYLAHWRHYMQQSDLSEEEEELMISSFDEAIPILSTVSGYLSLLEEAGFDRVLCPYWYEMYAVLVAFK
ncbi:MAG: class I SAM-dependent methyltransferase [Methanomicrobiaceae archaeon]|nr:class I SAM-dependent methyltransferase [Methanomicrobiaceae archaeon]